MKQILRKKRLQFQQILITGAVFIFLVYISKKNRPNEILRDGFADGFYQLDNEDIYLYSAYVDARSTHQYLTLFGMQNRKSPSTFECDLEIGARKFRTTRKNALAVFPEWPSRDLLYVAYMYFFRLDVNVTSLLGGDGVVLSAICGFDLGTDGEKERWRGRTVIPLSGVVWKKPDKSAPEAKEPSVGICVKAAYGKLNETRLVEWLSWQAVLGVRHVAVYDSAVTGAAATAVLAHYRRAGLVTTTPFGYLLKMQTLMKQDPMRVKLASEDLLLEQGYLVSLNDCLYRYANQFDFILIIDFDEVIIPHGDFTLGAMLGRAVRYHPGAAAYTFETAWHLDEYGPITPAPPAAADDKRRSASAPLLLHTAVFRRRTAPLRSQPKSAVSAALGVAVNWHTAVLSAPGARGGNRYLPPDEYGFLHHYRYRCKYDKKRCAELSCDLVVDDAVDRYEAQIESAVREARAKIGV